MIKRDSFYCSPAETREEVLNETLRFNNIKDSQIISIQEYLAIQDDGCPDASMRIVFWYREDDNEKM